MTLGVRALVIDRQGRIFLVKHSYVSGWHLPGGGVEAGETLTAGAGARVARGGQYRARPSRRRCTACSSTTAISRRDHVALFVVRDFRQSAAPVPDHEIVAHGFFAVDALPNDTTAATRARIVEVLGGAPVERALVRTAANANATVSSLVANRLSFDLIADLVSALVADHRGGVSRAASGAAIAR